MKTKWKIKKYSDDESLSWEERYSRLEAHHAEESKFLVDVIEQLESQVESLQFPEVSASEYNHGGGI